MEHQIGLLLFPDVQQLDLTGPYEIFASVPGTVMHLVSPTMDPVRTSSGIVMLPTVRMDECPQFDVVCVPGGGGVDALMTDETTLSFLRRQAQGARFITSVCTGALVLGAAGLLVGRRATTHWAAHDLLAAFGAVPTHGRVVRDGNVFTGGGVTAGIDFALTVVAELAGRKEAEAAQLHLEYAPAPPFEAGDPKTAPADVLARVRALMAPGRAKRAAIAATIAEHCRATTSPDQTSNA